MRRRAGAGWLRSDVGAYEAPAVGGSVLAQFDDILAATATATAPELAGHVQAVKFDAERTAWTSSPMRPRTARSCAGKHRSAPCPVRPGDPPCRLPKHCPPAPTALDTRLTSPEPEQILVRLRAPDEEWASAFHEAFAPAWKEVPPERPQPPGQPGVLMHFVLDRRRILTAARETWSRRSRRGTDPSVPLYGFVFLVALGVDYNIFLMSRVREETLRHGTREGASVGGSSPQAGSSPPPGWCSPRPSPRSA